MFIEQKFSNKKGINVMQVLNLSSSNDLAVVYCPYCGKQLAVQPDKEETLKEIKKLLEEVQEKINKISKEEST